MRGSRRELPGRIAVLAAVLAVGHACASAPRPGAPLEQPGAEAERRRAATGVAVPYDVRFRWEYGDEGGRLRGDGLARVNPPDSFRLDLFTTGEGSMSVALVDDSLQTRGRIEDVELPAPPFLYAMAGLFRPGGDGRLVAGRRMSDGATLEYEVAGGARRVFRFEGGRLAGVEERSDGGTRHRIRISWEGEAAWPRAAEYRDLETPRRVQWWLDDAEARGDSHPASIFRFAPDG